MDDLTVASFYGEAASRATQPEFLAKSLSMLRIALKAEAEGDRRKLELAFNQAVKFEAAAFA